MGLNSSRISENKYDLPSIDVNYFKKETIDFHSEIILLYVLKGQVSVTVGAESYQLGKDHIIVVNSNKSFVLAPEDESILCRIKIPQKMISEHIGQSFFLILCNTVTHPRHEDDNIRKILNKLVKHYIVSENEHDLNCQGMMFQLVYQLVENYLLNRDGFAPYNNTARSSDRIQERMELVLSYIHDNYAKPITLRELAKQLYLTEAYLSRFLKKTLHMNFSDYLNKIRIHYAVEDLLYSSKSITHIALDNGFSSISSFIKVFKDTYNMTPRKYKESILSKHSTDILEPKLAKTHIKKILNAYLSPAPKYTDKRLLSVQVNSGEFRPFASPWNAFLNIGDINYMRDYRIRTDIRRLKSSFKFTYVRLYNILTDKMLIGQYISDNLRDYNFSYIDECLDFLMQNELKPFFFVGYKVEANNQEMPLPISNLFSFATLDELCNVLRILLDHLIQRYGMEEVNSWLFEVWHPEVYYKVPQNWHNEQGEEICSIRIYHLLRKTLQSAKIGGAEYALIAKNRNNIRKQMLIYQRAQVDFDFISCVSYPYHSKKSTESNFMHYEVTVLREIMDEVGIGQKPIWMTEYNLTGSNRNMLNDTSFKGAYILKNMFSIAEEVGMAGYWLMSDIYSESRETHKILYGGNGLVSKDGINKPVYYAHLFLSQSKSHLIKCDENILFTTDGHDNYSIIVHNMQQLSHYTYLKKEDALTMEDLELLFENSGVLDIHIHINNMRPGNYRTICCKLDRLHGDIIELWKSNSFIEHFNIDEIHYLKNNMPEMMIKINSTNHNRSLVLTESLEPNYFLCYKLELTN